MSERPMSRFIDGYILALVIFMKPEPGTVLMWIWYVAAAIVGFETLLLAAWLWRKWRDA